MYIEAVPNRGSPPAILLRESYREAGKVKKRTLLNLSDWPHERIAGFKALLKGGTVIPKDQDAITIIRSLPHGALDWLAVRQPAIEAALAKRHFTGGTLVLYDVSSSYMEGRCCPLAQFGYSRKPAPAEARGKRGKRQIVYCLLSAPDGCPVAIEVFSCST